MDDFPPPPLVLNRSFSNYSSEELMELIDYVNSGMDFPSDITIFNKFLVLESQAENNWDDFSPIQHQRIEELRNRYDFLVTRINQIRRSRRRSNSRSLRSPSRYSGIRGELRAMNWRKYGGVTGWDTRSNRGIKERMRKYGGVSSRSRRSPSCYSGLRGELRAMKMNRYGGVSEYSGASDLDE